MFKPIAVEMRAVRVNNPIDWKIKSSLIDWNCRQAGCGNGDSVIAAYAGNDLLLFGTAQGIVKKPG